MVTIERNGTVNPGAGGFLDWVGTATSALCALHCGLLPMVAAVLPTAGIGFLTSESTETALIAASAALGSISLGLGFRRHRSGRALAMLAAGLGMLTLGRFGEAGDAEAIGMVGVVSGGLAIAGSHLLNRRLCRACPRCGRVTSRRDVSSASPVDVAGLDKGRGEARS